MIVNDYFDIQISTTINSLNKEIFIKYKQRVNINFYIYKKKEAAAL